MTTWAKTTLLEVASKVYRVSKPDTSSRMLHLLPLRSPSFPPPGGANQGGAKRLEKVSGAHTCGLALIRPRLTPRSRTCVACRQMREEGERKGEGSGGKGLTGLGAWREEEVGGEGGYHERHLRLYVKSPFQTKALSLPSSPPSPPPWWLA